MLRFAMQVGAVNGVVCDAGGRAKCCGLQCRWVREMVRLQVMEEIIYEMVC